MFQSYKAIFMKCTTLKGSLQFIYIFKSLIYISLNDLNDLSHIFLKHLIFNIILVLTFYKKSMTQIF
jgi:hypothetical protein